jgi:N-acetylneuraminic acid mutarotase
MKKILTLSLFIVSMITLQAQTIVWRQLASLPQGYRNGEAVTINDQVYFVAGCSDNTWPPFFYKYEPANNTWTKMANLPGSTQNLSLATVNGKIYAIGGDPIRNTNFEYNPETNTWRTLAPMPTGRQHIDCGIFENKIYVIGGLDNWINPDSGTISKKNEVYDIATNTWSEKTAIPSLRNNPAIVSIDSLIYVIGGGGSETNIWTNIATVECYNILTDTWEQKNDLPYPVFKPAAIVMHNNIIVMGGIATINGQDSCLNKVLLYKAETDEWQEITPLPEENIFFGCTSIGNKIYIMGGMKGVPPNYTTLSSVYEGEYIESNVTEYQQNKIQVFPNPAKKLITIKNIDTKNAEIFYKIMHVNGEILQQGKLVNDTINISGLQAGCYLLLIETKNLLLYKGKVVIE